MSDLKRSGWGGARDGRAIRGGWSTTRARAPATGAAVEPETVRLLRLGRDPIPHTLSTGVPAAPALAPDKAELVRRARLGECGAVHRLCMWALRPARRIVDRYLGPTEREGAEELLFGSCRRAVEALQQAPEDDRTLDFEREVRIAVRVAHAAAMCCDGRSRETTGVPRRRLSLTTSWPPSLHTTPTSCGRLGSRANRGRDTHPACCRPAIMPSSTPICGGRCAAPGPWRHGGITCHI